MMRGAPKLLLVFSLSLNFFFVGGYLYMHDIMKRYSTVYSRMGLLLDSLPLDPSERAALNPPMDDWLNKAKAYRAEHFDEATRCWTVLQRDESSPQEVQEAIQSASAIQRGGTVLSLEFLRAVMLKIKPAQRKTLIDTIRNSYKL